MHFDASASARKLLVATAVALLLAFASTPSRAQDEDPPAQAGRLSYVSGAVSIQEVGSDEWIQAVPNLPLGPGDRVFTDSNGRAEIQVGQTYLRIGPNADVSFSESIPNRIVFAVVQGTVHVRCNGLWQGQALQLNTPNGTGVVYEPGELRLEVLPDQDAAIFTDLANQVTTYGAQGFRQSVYAGQSLELAGSNPVFPQWLQPTGPDDLDYWSQQRDQQIQNAASYQYVSPEIPGAYELDASGSWQPGTEYGAVWFPNNVPNGWAPYHYGHWVNHAPWGWVWVEDESWGYAPFHYGRWVNYNGRWGWVPGPPAAHPVWSPALVVFAGGIHVGGVGVSVWFPLGPGEAYKPWYHASPHYIDQVNISNIGESRRVHVQTNYVNIVNVTNVTNITYVNRTIGVTAMRHDDFAAGRSARQAPVVVDVHVMDHVQVLDRPEPQPAPHATMAPPVTRPVPAKTERPAVINASGKMVSTKPGAPAVEPPAKPAPPVKPLPGRTVVAAPPPGRPAAAPAAKPAPAPTPASKPAVAPAPAITRPVAPPAAQPTQKPVPPAAAKPVPQPTVKPAPPATTAPAAHPEAKPVPPVAAKPTVPPAQPTVKPAAPPAIKPVPQPTAPPAVKPTAPTAVKPTAPAVKPTAPPAAKPAPQPTAKPATPPAGTPADKTKGKKSDKQKKDETKPETKPQ